MKLDILLKRVAMSRKFGRGNLQHLVADVGKNTNEPKVYMNGHRLYKFEYIIDKDNNLKVKDSVFEKFRNKDIIGYKEDGNPIYEKNDIYVEGVDL